MAFAAERYDTTSLDRDLVLRARLWWIWGVGRLRVGPWIFAPIVAIPVVFASSIWFEGTMMPLVRNGLLWRG